MSTLLQKSIIFFPWQREAGSKLEFFDKGKCSPPPPHLRTATNLTPEKFCPQELKKTFIYIKRDQRAYSVIESLMVCNSEYASTWSDNLHLPKTSKQVVAFMRSDNLLQTCLCTSLQIRPLRLLKQVIWETFGKTTTDRSDRAERIRRTEGKKFIN